MMAILNPRQQSIQELLSQKGSLTAQDLVDHFDVSIATVYRDLNQLVNSGLAIKIQRGIAVAPRKGSDSTFQQCSQCGHTVANRTAFAIQLSGGKQLSACCPHCGLMLLDQHPEALTAIATDFLYLNKINVSAAAFLVNSNVTVCCSPSVLCFANPDEAEGFQKGFGGEILGFEAARDRISAIMSLQPLHSAH